MPDFATGPLATGTLRPAGCNGAEAPPRPGCEAGGILCTWTPPQARAKQGRERGCPAAPQAARSPPGRRGRDAQWSPLECQILWAVRERTQRPQVGQRETPGKRGWKAPCGTPKSRPAQWRGQRGYSGGTPVGPGTSPTKLRRGIPVGSGAAPIFGKGVGSVARYECDSIANTWVSLVTFLLRKMWWI